VTSHIEGTEGFERVAHALRDADKLIYKELNAGFRRVAKPLGKDVAVTAASELPRRGGLAFGVAGATPGIAGISGRNAGVSIRMTVRQGWYLGRIDEGVIRHPVFNRKGPDGKRLMRDQHIRAGAFSRPFQAGAPRVRKEIVASMEKVVDEIARKGNA
jgi:hypothetical protein